MTGWGRFGAVVGISVLLGLVEASTGHSLDPVGAFGQSGLVAFAVYAYAALLDAIRDR